MVLLGVGTGFRLRDRQEAADGDSDPAKTSSRSAIVGTLVVNAFRSKLQWGENESFTSAPPTLIRSSPSSIRGELWRPHSLGKGGGRQPATTTLGGARSCGRRRKLSAKRTPPSLSLSLFTCWSLSADSPLHSTVRMDHTRQLLPLLPPNVAADFWFVFPAAKGEQSTPLAAGSRLGDFPLAVLAHIPLKESLNA